MARRLNIHRSGAHFLGNQEVDDADIIPYEMIHQTAIVVRS